jgi:hypothetical protein
VEVNDGTFKVARTCGVSRRRVGDPHVFGRENWGAEDARHVGGKRMKLDEGLLVSVRTGRALNILY